MVYDQECTVRRIKGHYQNKLNILRRILDIYQEKVEKKNADWEKMVAVSAVHQSVCPSVTFQTFV